MSDPIIPFQFEPHLCISEGPLIIHTVLLMSGAFKDAVSLATFSLSLLSQETMRSQYAAAIWAGLHATCMPSGIFCP